MDASSGISLVFPASALKMEETATMTPAIPVQIEELASKRAFLDILLVYLDRYNKRMSGYLTGFKPNELKKKVPQDSLHIHWR